MLSACIHSDPFNCTAHMDYLHFNLVKHGYVERVADWPFSTLKKCVEQGIYPPDWAGGAQEAMAAGEPIG